MDSLRIHLAAAFLSMTTMTTHERFVQAPSNGGADLRVGVAVLDDPSDGNASADCNENGVEDELDILLGTSLDRNDNGIPDECERGQPGGGPLGATAPSRRFGPGAELIAERLGDAVRGSHELSRALPRGVLDVAWIPKAGGLVIAELTVHRATPGRIELYGELRCYGLDGTCREVAAVRAVVETL